MVERTTQGMRSSSLSFSLRLGISASKYSTYFTEFKPLAFAVSIIEYKIALAFAQLAVFLNNQFFATDHKGFYRALRAIIVDVQLTVLCVSGELFPLPQRVSDRLTQRGFRIGLLRRFIEPRLEFSEQR
jgi:hypothetical protein